MATVLEPPTVPDLITRPELAALHVLDVVLDAAITALTAAHADVFWDEDLQFEQRPEPNAVRAAEEILGDALKLRRALAQYRPDRTPPWVVQQLAFDLDAGEGDPF